LPIDKDVATMLQNFVNLILCKFRRLLYKYYINFINMREELLEISITFIFSFSAASNSAIFAIESTRTLEPNTYK